ncbi:hypothetical protein T12_11678 [Trichinella patagoniensis]|uniref:Uncharacterized protein n=1 Tax=Trichinella patagoniensis TaxID=990121 RepID=A0A0V0Z265_9BILA|nr:hypothetical protein T12_11678 [Trichinella patagoniensis]
MPCLVESCAVQPPFTCRHERKNQNECAHCSTVIVVQK